MKVIDLLNKIANGEEVPEKVEYENKIYHIDELENFYVSDDRKALLEYIFDYLNDYDALMSEVEIIEDTLEEENELHANSVEFNINNNKRDCVITLDENDLGIDKLHLDNCYFYKENDKWYVKKYDFKSFKLEEEKKIPEKLPNNFHYTGEEEVLADKINEIINYLKSKGE